MRGSDLSWPEGFERTDPDDREAYPHGFRVSRSRAFDNILEELRKMDARNAQVETAAPHTAKEPHRPYADRNPEDPGVVVYFERDGRQFAVPCDRWDNLRDNAQAIAKYLNAKRALDRYGVETVDSEFSTQALPPADEDAIAAPPAPSEENDEEPHEVLGVALDADDEVVEAVGRRLTRKYHPDANGGDGDREQLQRVLEAKEAMLDE